MFRFSRRRLQLGLFTVCCLAFSLLFLPRAQAFGVDFLGDATKPIISPAQENLKKLFVYIWLQPYAGYGWGTSDQTRIAAGGATTSASDLSTSGLLYGGRGGLLLMHSLRIGLDYSKHNIKRTTLLEGAGGVHSQQPVSGGNTMLGAILGFNVPRTPLKGFVTKYFRNEIQGDAAASGDGWGAGVSFLLKNPFILSLETRKLKFASEANPTGKRAEATFNQYYVTLSFMLL
jgi:hypothetical protein